MTDIMVRDEGSLIIIWGTTDEGRAWLKEHLDPQATRWGPGYVVETRYAGPILDGATDDGLEVG